MGRIAIICAVLAAISCSRKQEEIPTVTTMQSPSGKVIIYQLMVRLFGNKVTVNKSYGTFSENGVGKFSDITDRALVALKELGVTHVWYTGVIEHATLTDYTRYGIPLDDADVVKGRAGSPYAIKDYYDVNPDVADDVHNRMQEFEQLVERTHRNNLKVIIDFVPNHVARAREARDLGEDDDNSVRFSPDNNFYYLPGQAFVVPGEYVPLGPDNDFPTKDGKFEETPAKATGNDQFTANPGIDDWFETVKLNYGVDIEANAQAHFDPVPNTWFKMRDILVHWAGKKVDGFRCDMAEMVPVEFWNWVVPQVKAVNPDIVFIAEIYNPAAYRDYIGRGRFDYLYDKVQLYDTLRLLINGKCSTTDIGEIQQTLSGINDHMLHFLENHDEQRIASRFFAGDAWKAVPGMVISATIDKGPVMIYFGQEVGEPALGEEGFQGDDGRTTIFDYWGVPEHQKWMNGGRFDGGQLSEEQARLRHFYSVLLNLAASNRAVVSGDYYDLTAHNIYERNFSDKVFACLRSASDATLLIIAGFNPSTADIEVSVPHEVAAQLGLDAETKYTGTDLLWNQKEVVIEDLALKVQLPPFGAYIFQVR
jgi:glycosidase